VRCPAPGWALLEEVRDAAGWDAKRSIDALALSLFRSGGLELHGFEIKASRGDWLRELRDPEKADATAKFCDRWWLAVESADVVLDGELPPTWGLLVLRGKRLHTVTAAEKRVADPISRELLATMFKRAVRWRAEMVHPDDLAARVAEEVGKASVGSVEALALRRLEARSQCLDRLSVALGVDVTGEYQVPNITKAYEVVMHQDRRDWYRDSLERAKEQADTASARAAETLAMLDAIEPKAAP